MVLRNTIRYWRNRLVAQVAVLPFFITAWIGLISNVCSATTDGHRFISPLDLANVRDIGGSDMYSLSVHDALSISPDGKYAAFQLQKPNISANSYDLSWMVIETTAGGSGWTIDNGGDLILNPNHLPAPLGNRLPTTAQWSSDGEWIIYLKRIDGSTQLWRSKRSGEATEQLTHNSADILSFQFSEGGNEIFFSVALPYRVISEKLRKEADRGYLYDDRFHPRKLRRPMVRPCSTNGEGRVREVSIERACTAPLWVYDIASKAERKATPNEVKAYREAEFATPELAAKDKYLLTRRSDRNRIWLENEDPKRFPGYRPPLRLSAALDGETFRCNAKICSAYRGIIERARWRPGANEIIFQRADGSNQSMTGLYSWNLDLNRVRTIVQTEDQLANCEVLPDRAICLRERWTHPRTIVAVDLSAGRIKTIYDPNPDFNDLVFSKIEKIEWEDRFGNPTHGHLVYPLGYEKGRRYPLVITTYRSRGFLRGGIGDEYPIHVLAANGFTILSHDMPRRLERDAIIPFSGQAQFEDNYERLSSLSAQTRILDILTQRGLIDPARIAITGLSDGAAQVTFALIHTDRFAAAIASSAYDYRSSYYAKNQQGRAFRRHVFGGTPDNDSKNLYKSMSIELNAGRVNTPFLINVSDHELPDSVEAFARLQDADRAVEMFVYPEEYHLKWQPRHRLAIYRRNIQWLKYWLMGQEEPAPLDPEQYQRWSELRRLLEKNKDVDVVQ